VSSRQIQGVLGIDYSHDERGAGLSQDDLRNYKHAPVIRRRGDPITVFEGASAILLNGPVRGGSREEVEYLWKLSQEKKTDIIYVALYRSMHDLYSFYESPFARALFETFGVTPPTGNASNEDMIFPCDEKFTKIVDDEILRLAKKAGRVPEKEITTYAKAIAYEKGKFTHALISTSNVPFLKDVTGAETDEPEMYLEFRSLKPENVILIRKMKCEEDGLMTIDKNNVKSCLGHYLGNLGVAKLDSDSSRRAHELLHYDMKVLGFVPVGSARLYLSSVALNPRIISKIVSSSPRSMLPEPPSPSEPRRFIAQDESANL